METKGHLVHLWLVKSSQGLRISVELSTCNSIPIWESFAIIFVFLQWKMNHPMEFSIGAIVYSDEQSMGSGASRKETSTLPGG